MVRRPLKILMLLHGYMPDDPRVASEARAATDAGFEVDVIALRRPGEAPSDEVDGARYFRLPLEHKRGRGLAGTVTEYVGFVLLAAARAAALARRRRYDVVQVHNPPDFLVLAALAPRALGARIVLDVHDLSSDMFAMRFGERAGAHAAERLLRAVERWAARASTEVITVHEPYRRELAARGIPETKLSVVMNTLDERLLPPPSVDPPTMGFTVVYHGTVTPHYGVGLLVDSVPLIGSRIPGLSVEIYGEGDAVASLRRRAFDLDVDDTVHMSGQRLPREEVLKAAQRASVGVVPNLPTKLNRYALSTKLFEYVALGIPVVSADLPTIREHFSDDEVLFFRAGDPGSLAEALVHVFENPDAAAAMASSARRRYESYRWPNNARTYVEVIRRAASRSRKRNGRVVPRR